MIAEDDDGTAVAPVGAGRLLADAARGAQGGRKRLAVLVDLFLPESMRLTDYQRVTVKRFIIRLVGSVEHDLRERLITTHNARFTPEIIAALGSARVPIALPLLQRARALHDVELVSLLLARVEEQRLSEVLRRNGGDTRVVETLLADPDETVSAAAMAMLIAESRRHFLFEEPVLARTDLPADMQYRLVWWVAAALREYLTRQHGADHGLADAALMDAAAASLSGHDEGETLESAAMQLAYALAERGRLDDDLLQTACEEGRLSLFVAALAVRGGLDFEAARGMALPPFGERLIVLLRALDVRRESAGAVALALSIDDAELTEQMTAYDSLTRARAIELIQPWQVDSGYRTAIAALSAGLAERGDGWAA
jgi:uncharacterized protein (DUF2336 family)